MISDRVGTSRYLDIGIGYFPGSKIIVEQVRGIVIEFVQAILHDGNIQSVTIVPE